MNGYGEQQSFQLSKIDLPETHWRKVPSVDNSRICSRDSFCCPLQRHLISVTFSRFHCSKVLLLQYLTECPDSFTSRPRYSARRHLSHYPFLHACLRISNHRCKTTVINAVVSSSRFPNYSEPCVYRVVKVTTHGGPTYRAH